MMKKENETQIEPVGCALEPAYAGTYKMEDTIEMMKSPHYRTRFVAEYVQLKIRYEKLKHLLSRWEAFGNKFSELEKPPVDEEERMEDFINWLGFVPTCSFRLLRAQQEQMGELLHTLEVRAAVEDIDLRLVTIKL